MTVLSARLRANNDARRPRDAPGACSHRGFARPGEHPSTPGRARKRDEKRLYRIHIYMDTCIHVYIYIYMYTYGNHIHVRLLEGLSAIDDHPVGRDEGPHRRVGEVLAARLPDVPHEAEVGRVLHAVHRLAATVARSARARVFLFCFFVFFMGFLVHVFCFLVFSDVSCATGRRDLQIQIRRSATYDSQQLSSRSEPWEPLYGPPFFLSLCSSCRFPKFIFS